MQWIKDYLWFIKESQKYMEGYNKVIVFIKSLYKGIDFSNSMKKDRIDWAKLKKIVDNC